MATTIKLKNGSGAPAASDLVQGEPALDLTNNRLYSENGSGSVVEIGTNPTSLSINGTAITSTAAELNILDGVTATAAELNILDGVTSTTAELNILDGVTATAAELNILDGVTSTAAELNILDGVTATTAELNYVDGVTSNIQTQLDAKGTGTVSSLSDLSVTATAAELNILDGVTSTTAELNILDGVTSTAAELNILDGVTSTAAEINLLDGVTATTAEINYLDITTLGTSEASKAVTADANGDVTFAGDVTFSNAITEDYESVSDSSGTTTVDLSTGTNFSSTLSANTQFAFTNPASSGSVSAFTLKIVQDASASGYTVTWPATVDWPSATAPTLTATASAVDYFVFITHDGGTTYYGFTAGQALG